MTRRTSLLLLAALAAVLGLAGCGGGPGAASLASDDVATVGSEHITRAQFDQLLGQAEKSYKKQGRAFPKAGSPEYQTLRDQIMAFLVQKAEFAQKAADLGIKIDDKKVDERLTQLKKQYFGGSEKKYLATLKAQGMTDSQVRDDLKTQLVSEQLFNKVTSDVKVSDSDLKRYYDGHKQQFSQPASRQVRHILVKSKSLADKLYAQLKGGADFATLAKKYSQDPGSKAQGGKLTVSKGQTVPPFDKAAFSLKKNELSKPIKTTYGWHIIQPLGPVKPAKITPFAQVKLQIKGQLEQTKKQDKMRKWVDDVKKEFKDKIHYAAGFAPATTGTTGATSTG
jgi:parvulin-like peptidyl-prolyl isomerase